VAVQCDKCGQKIPVPSRNHQTCNRHQIGEKTGYCQGTLRPAGQMATGSYVPPPANTRETGHESR
jgi:hypothetical protein